MSITHVTTLRLAIFYFAGLCLSLPVLADEGEPIAYIGHGGFFDSTGKQLTVTTEFVTETQAWYRNALLKKLDKTKRSEYDKLEKSLFAKTRVEGQAKLGVQQHLLKVLSFKAGVTKNDRMIGKLNALQFALQWQLPNKNDNEPNHAGKRFELPAQLQKILDLPEFNPGGIHVLSVTTNSGQAYINECATAGVPIPPPIGRLDPTGLAGWKSQGFIPQAQQFIVGTPAEVRTFHSTSPEGMCIALPRYTNVSLTTVSLDGVICMGKVSSKVCFWDNQMNGVGFSFASGTQIPIGAPDLSINAAGLYQAGGVEIENGSGGVCTDCHAGQNPYIVHPDADLGGGVLFGSLGQAPQNLPMFANSRYDPLVGASWPQNNLSQSPTYVPGVCVGCHVNGGGGGAFPHLSTDYPGYCNSVLANAVAGSRATMPPGSAGSQAGNADVVTFRNWCGQPKSSGPSDRGDPHLLTTNGINYDFQAAGEFTALRNASNQFELQTRQTPVTTTFTPGENPHTGLASCVSLNTAVAVRVGTHRLTYQPRFGKLEGPEQLDLRLDGELIQLTAAPVQLGNGNVIARADASGGIDIQIADGTRVIVTPNFWQSQGYWYLNVDVVNTPAREGTMGYILKGDWLPRAQDGTSFGPKPASIADRHTLLNHTFADAWRVKANNSLFDYAPGTSTADFTDRQWPPLPGQECKVSKITHRLPVKPIKVDVAKRLCRAIKDPAVFNNCVFDVSVMGEPGLAKAYLRSIKLKEQAEKGLPFCVHEKSQRDGDKYDKHVTQEKNK